MTEVRTQTKKRSPGLKKGFSGKGNLVNRQGFFQTSDQERLFYDLKGKANAPLLVFCDGIGCDGYIWKYLIDHLAHDHLTFHWNYRGHGKSSIPETYSCLTIAQMALDLEEILESLPETRGKRPILIGHSMGVQVVLEFFQHFPQRPKALICICGAAGHALDNFMHSKVLKTIFPVILQFFRSAPAIARLLWQQVLAQPNGYYPAVLLQLTSSLCAKEDLQPYLDHLGQIDSRVFLELAEDMGKHSVENFLENFDVPTLVFAGNRDRFTPIPQSKIIAEKIPNAEFCLVPGGTHTAPLELPHLFNLRIRRFLETI